MYEFILFSRGKVMNLDRYFKITVLQDSTIHPTVIASMNRKRDREVEAGYLGSYSMSSLSTGT